MAQHESGENSRPTEQPRKIESTHVGLPEYLRRETAEGLLPHTVAYFMPDALTYDEQTKKIWFYTNSLVRNANLSLESYVRTKQNFIAIMPVIDADGARKYVLDATGMRSGQLDIEEDWLGYKDEDEDDEISETLKRKRLNHSTIAAAAFTNLEGEMEFHGEAEYFDALHYLVNAYDAHLLANKKQDDYDYISQVVEAGDPSVTDGTDSEEETTEEQAVTPEETKADTTKIELIFRLPEDPYL